MHPSIPTNPPVNSQVTEAISGRPAAAESLLPALRSIQTRNGPPSQQMIAKVSSQLGVPASQAQGVSTFYSMLRSPPDYKTIRLCDGIVCWLHGAEHCRNRLQAAANESGHWSIERGSCLGLCDRAPAAFVDGAQIGPVDSQRPLESITSATHRPRVISPIQDEANRVILERVERIDPDSIDEAMQLGAYAGFTRALTMSPDEVIGEIETAGLTGRGGAAFPTARKWRMVSASQRPRYVVCNADESEPLMFKDRVLLESDPHAVIEGMLIAAYAVGAEQGFIYIRGEYEPQAKRLEHAIEQARDHGLLSVETQGRDFRFDIHIHRGAGAYVCGEETALLESLEGRRGEPRVRPPYPVQTGYRGCPTAVNNVETLATAAVILRLGAQQYRTTGNPQRPGTRLCTILGHVNTPGLFEIPHGLTVRRIIEQFGGGLRPQAEFHFALMGGAAGTFIPDSLLDIPLDEHAHDHGVAIGSGGVLVCDQSISVPEALLQLLRFFERESCGKCTPCRVGTSECRRLLDRLISRQGSQGDLERVRAHARLLKSASLCGLGTSAADPIQSALANFPDEFLELLP